MNLIVGDSHIHFAFNEVDQTSITECLKLIKSDGWTGLSHRDGLTIYSASRNIEDELLSNNIDIPAHINMVWMFGTNDALINRKEGKSPEEYIPIYIDSIERIRIKYKIKKAYVICPFYINRLDQISHWDPIRSKMNSYEQMNHIIEGIRRNILSECKKYKNIYAIDMSKLFEIKEDLFATEYCLDGVHFNAEGQKIFLDRIKKIIDT